MAKRKKAIVKTEKVKAAVPAELSLVFQNKFKESRAREIVRLGGGNANFSGNNSDQNAYRVAKGTGKEGEDLVVEVYKVLGGTFGK